MENIEFCHANRSDIKPIFDMLSLLVKKYEDPTVVDVQHALQWCLTKIEGNIEAYTCICINQKKIGYYHLVEQLDLRTELDDFYILPEYRKKGIGTIVLKQIQKETDETIYLYVFQKNQRAIAFYEKNGFIIKQMISPTRMIMEYRK